MTKVSEELGLSLVPIHNSIYIDPDIRYDSITFGATQRSGVSAPVMIRELKQIAELFFYSRQIVAAEHSHTPL
jgi:hypothetical protein